MYVRFEFVGIVADATGYTSCKDNSFRDSFSGPAGEFLHKNLQL